MTTDPNLEFLAVKSKELIDKQIASYRQQHTTASSIIAIVALFIPLFLGGLTDSYEWIQYASVLPVLLFLIATCFLLFHVFLSRSLSQALNFDEFQRLVNANDLEKTLLFEIGANRSSFQDNKSILRSRNRYYNISVNLTILGIVISVVLLMLNKFFKPLRPKEPIQIEVVNKIALTDSAKRDTIIVTLIVPKDSLGRMSARNTGYPIKKIIINQKIETQNIQKQNIKNK
jgi:hypothetical protein